MRKTLIRLLAGTMLLTGLGCTSPPETQKETKKNTQTQEEKQKEDEVDWTALGMIAGQYLLGETNPKDRALGQALYILNSAKHDLEVAKAGQSTTNVYVGGQQNYPLPKNENRASTNSNYFNRFGGTFKEKIDKNNNKVLDEDEAPVFNYPKDVFRIGEEINTYFQCQTEKSSFAERLNFKLFDPYGNLCDATFTLGLQDNFHSMIYNLKLTDNNNLGIYTAEWYVYDELVYSHTFRVTNK